MAKSSRLEVVDVRAKTNLNHTCMYSVIWRSGREKNEAAAEVLLILYPFDLLHSLNLSDEGKRTKR